MYRSDIVQGEQPLRKTQDPLGCVHHQKIQGDINALLKLGGHWEPPLINITQIRRSLGTTENYTTITE